MLLPQTFYNIPNLDPLYQSTRHQYDGIYPARNFSRGVPSCGTGVLYRRAALTSLGGFCFGTVEDTPTSLALHTAGWRSYFHPRRLQHGLVPNDLQGYIKQRQRWTLGNMEIVGKWDPIYSPASKLSLQNRLNYWYAAVYYVAPFLLTVHMFGLLLAHVLGLEWAGVSNRNAWERVLTLLAAKGVVSWGLRFCSHMAVASPYRTLDRVRHVLYLYWSGPLTIPGLVSYLVPSLKVSFGSANEAQDKLTWRDRMGKNAWHVASHVMLVGLALGTIFRVVVSGVQLLRSQSEGVYAVSVDETVGFAGASTACGGFARDILAAYTALWVCMTYSLPLWYLMLPDRLTDPDRGRNLHYEGDGVPHVLTGKLEKITWGAWVLTGYEVV